MLKSSFNLRMPLVDHCCGVCTLTKKPHTATWCISSNHCTGGCDCANYTADCEFPEEMTGMNDSETDQVMTVLCTPCSEQFTDLSNCTTLCEGDCLVEEKTTGVPGQCIRCVISKTCGWTAAPPENSICDCNVDCFNINCVAPGTTMVTFCEVKTWAGGPMPPDLACPDCDDVIPP
jgi:hypothetical protein